MTNPDVPQTSPIVFLGGTDYSGIPGRELTRVMIDPSISPMIFDVETGDWRS